MKRKKHPVWASMVVVAVLAATGCASSFMVPTEAIAPGPDYAVVNFLRPSSYGGAIKFGIWDRDTIIGVLTPKRYIQYKASPGEHIFMARAENWSVVKATVEAGRIYYILAEPRMGAWKARVAMTVLQPDDRRVDKWMGALTPIAMDPSKREGYAAEHAPGARTAAQNVEAGKAEYTFMKATDGR